MMASTKQIAANKLNSQKSTGPKTNGGRAKSCKNAIKHGLLSEETILPWEDDAAFEDLRENLTSALRPDGGLEEILVDRIVWTTWRLRRAGRIEAGIFVWRKYSILLNQAIVEAQSYVKNSALVDTDVLFPPTITDQDKYDAARQDVSENSIMANSDLPALGRTFVGDANAIANLSRYETGLEKSLYKALHELQRLQASRDGGVVLPPAAIDVHSDAEITGL